MFDRRWSRRRFIKSIVAAIVCYVSLTLAFPFALTAFAAATNCAKTTGACGVVGLVFSSGVKPLVYGLFLFSLAGPLIGRLRDIGCSPWLSLFVLFLVVTDNAFLVYGGAPGSFAFSAGVLQIDSPIFLLTALALMVVLSIVPARDGRVRLRTIGWPAWLALAIAVPVVFAAIYRLAWSFPGLLGTIVPLIRLVAPMIQVGIYALIVLPPAVAFALWPRAGEVVADAPSPPAGPRLPLVRMALAALALATMVTLIFGPIGAGLWWWFMLPAAMVPMILPNALLFFAIILASYLWVRQRLWTAAALTVVLVAIYGSWGYQLYLKAHLTEQDERAIAAVETYQPEVMPRAILLDGQNASNGDFMQVLLERDDIDIIATRTGTGFVGYRTPRSEEAIPDPKTGWVKKVITYDIATLPDPHLVLKTWSYSSFFSGSHPGGQYEGGSPYELRIVGSEGDHLVALWYRRIMRQPFWLPVLTINGWREEGNYGDHAQRDEAATAFIKAALGGN